MYVGEEYVFVLSGIVIVFVGDDLVELGVGESIIFWSVEFYFYVLMLDSELLVCLFLV